METELLLKTLIEEINYYKCGYSRDSFERGYDAGTSTAIELIEKKIESLKALNQYIEGKTSEADAQTGIIDRG